METYGILTPSDIQQDGQSVTWIDHDKEWFSYSCSVDRLMYLIYAIAINYFKFKEEEHFNTLLSISIGHHRLLDMVKNKGKLHTAIYLQQEAKKTSYEYRNRSRTKISFFIRHLNHYQNGQNKL